MLKRHKSSVEAIPHDVIELILERVPVKALVRFRCVSKKWRWTISSQRFQERQLIRRRQSRGPDVLFVSLFYDDDDEPEIEGEIVLGSSIVRKVTFPFPKHMICVANCDGLVCLYCLFTPYNILLNPVTQWHRSFPFSSVQQLIIDRVNKREAFSPTCMLGFGKDKLMGTYKPVWLYNSSEFALNNVTTCEVFDFSTNAWRYVVPASPYRILNYQNPVYLDGCLYWLTDCVDATVLSFDLHTETFKVIISKAPFAHVPDPKSVILSILDNRLCVSEKNWPTQEIWSLCSSGTWKILCSIDLTKTLPWFMRFSPVLLPVAILDKNKLLLHGLSYNEPLVLHDLHTKSYDLLSRPTTSGYCVSYFQSLFSLLSN